MPVTPNDILQVAQRALNASDEAELRCSISRSYYAAYHHAAAFAKTLPLPGSGHGPEGGIHQDLINRLSHPHPSCSAAQKLASKKIGYALASLRSARVCADYAIDSAIDKATAAQAWAKASGLIAS